MSVLNWSSPNVLTSESCDLSVNFTESKNLSSKHISFSLLVRFGYTFDVSLSQPQMRVIALEIMEKHRYEF